MIKSGGLSDVRKRRKCENVKVCNLFYEFVGTSWLLWGGGSGFWRVRIKNL